MNTCFWLSSIIIYWRVQKKEKPQDFMIQLYKEGYFSFITDNYKDFINTSFLTEWFKILLYELYQIYSSTNIDYSHLTTSKKKLEFLSMHTSGTMRNMYLAHLIVDEMYFDSVEERNSYINSFILDGRIKRSVLNLPFTKSYFMN